MSRFLLSLRGKKRAIYALQLKRMLSRPRAASTMLRMILRRLLGAARLTTMRLQQPIPSASKLASGLAADPQH
jgi:hypothetical protein